MKLDSRLVENAAKTQGGEGQQKPIEGRFLVEFVEATTKETKKGDGYLRLGMKVLSEGEHFGKIVYANLFVTYEYRGQIRFRTVFSGKRNPGLLQILGLKLTSEGFDETQLLGRQIKVDLEVDGEWQNIHKFSAVEG